MATLKRYATDLYDIGAGVSTKLGYDVRQAELPMRAVFTTVCVLLAGVIRVIFTKGLVTDTDISTVFTNIRQAEFPPLPFSPPVVDENNPNPAPPDLGA